MDLSVNIQLWQFVYALLFGAFLGVFYDVFRIIRNIINNGKMLIIFEDIIYLFVSSVLTFCFAFFINNGQLRFFIIIGIVLGLIVYYFTVGFIVMKSVNFIILLLKKIFGFVFALIIFPFVKIFILLKPFLRKTLKFFRKINFFCKKLFLFCKKNIMMYIGKVFTKIFKKGGFRIEAQNRKRKSIKASYVCNNYSSSCTGSNRIR